MMIEKSKNHNFILKTFMDMLEKRIIGS